MTVQVHPAAAETDQRATNNKESGEPRPGTQNLINLWDERTTAGLEKLDIRQQKEESD